MLKSKEILLFALSFWMWIGLAQAQGYTLYPNDTIEKTGTFDDLETLSIQQNNNSSTDTIHLKWRKILAQVPSDWEASVCDNGNCYTSLLDSGVMNPVLPSEYGLLLLHITPRKNPGTALVKYIVWEASNPGKQDTLTYILRVNSTLSLSQYHAGEDIVVVPCPVSGTFALSMVGSSDYQLLIYASNGQVMQSSFFSEIVSIDAANWPRGVYYISIIGKNKTFRRKICIL